LGDKASLLASYSCSALTDHKRMSCAFLCAVSRNKEGQKGYAMRTDSQDDTTGFVKHRS
jgi:hypothetical protein